MRNSVKTIVLTLALAGGSLTLSHPARAEVSIGIGGGGGIAFGYNDGYWDREHNWHRWRNRAEARRWRAENREHYFAWRHDRDRDLGWREERWWDRH